MIHETKLSCYKNSITNVLFTRSNFEFVEQKIFNGMTLYVYLPTYT